MTKLEQLIKELCPNGVPFVKLEEVCTLVTGATPSKTNPEYWEKGTIPWMNSGEVNNKIVYETENKITQLGYDKTSTTLVPIHTVVIALAGQGKTRGKVAITEIELCTNQSLCSIICGEKVNYKFLYHYLDSKYEELREISNGDGTRGGLSLRILKPYVIHLPPIEIQEEIVRILDNFTELTAELTAELTVRKKQYSYYLNHFFENSSAETVPLASLGSLKRGKRFVHADATDDGVPCIHYGELYTYYGVYANEVRSHIREDLRSKMRYATSGDVIIVGAGENKEDIGVGVAWYGEEDVAVHDACYTLSHKQNPKYISYFLRSNMYHQQIVKYVYEGKICSISAENVGKALIPIPSIEEQDRIVSILDRFNKLCTDLSVGLPAEIEARRKQYEYYRDKLLSFNVEEC